MTTAADRQAWLDNATSALGAKFQAAGFAVPSNLRVGFGWPKSGRGNHRIGECWGAQASGDNHHEIFISPSLGIPSDATDADRVAKSSRIVDVLAHEITHAIVGVEAGHKAPFKHCATAIGLTGKMTATVATPELDAWAHDLVARIGPFPTGGLNAGSGRKKQSTRMLKCVCPDCGYTVRTTRQWLADAGAPICPTDGTTFEAQ